MGITLLILVIVLMLVFVGASVVIANLQKNNTDSPGELQSHILQEFHKIEKPRVMTAPQLLDKNLTIGGAFFFVEIYGRRKIRGCQKIFKWK